MNAEWRHQPAFGQARHRWSARRRAPVAVDWSPGRTAPLGRRSGGTANVTLEDWQRIDPPAETAHLRPVAEHARVRIKGQLVAAEGVIPPGADATVVYRYSDEWTYEIEFTRPIGLVATLRRDEFDAL